MGRFALNWSLWGANWQRTKCALVDLATALGPKWQFTIGVEKKYKTQVQLISTVRWGKEVPRHFPNGVLGATARKDALARCN